jgi:hypothetical protein
MAPALVPPFYGNSPSTLSIVPALVPTLRGTGFFTSSTWYQPFFLLSMVLALILFMVIAQVHSLWYQPLYLLYMVSAVVFPLYGTSSHPLFGTSPGPPLYDTSSHPLFGTSPGSSSPWY